MQHWFGWALRQPASIDTTTQRATAQALKALNLERPDMPSSGPAGPATPHTAQEQLPASYRDAVTGTTPATASCQAPLSLNTAAVSIGNLDALPKLAVLIREEEMMLEQLAEITDMCGPLAAAGLLSGADLDSGVLQVQFTRVCSCCHCLSPCSSAGNIDTARPATPDHECRRHRSIPTAGRSTGNSRVAAASGFSALEDCTDAVDSVNLPVCLKAQGQLNRKAIYPWWYRVVFLL